MIEQEDSVCEIKCNYKFTLTKDMKLKLIRIWFLVELIIVSSLAIDVYYNINHIVGASVYMIFSAVISIMLWIGSMFISGDAEENNMLAVLYLIFPLFIYTISGLLSFICAFESIDTNFEGKVAFYLAISYIRIPCIVWKISERS